MVTEWTLFVIVLLSNAFLAAAIAILLNRRHPAPGRNAMIWMLGSLSFWAFCYAIITIAPTLELKTFWLKLENFGILTVPVFWFLFTVQYAQMDKWLTRSTGALLFLIPTISLIFIFSKSLLPLYYPSIQLYAGTDSPLVIQRGPWYIFTAIYSYLLDVVGMGVLIWRFIFYRNIYRRQLYILVGAVLVPSVVNLFYQFAPNISPSASVPIDLTPISFTITAFLLSAGVFGLRLFDLIPIARHTILENIPEMIFVVDAHDRVLDANLAAQKALGKSLEEIIGKDPLDVFRAWPQLINRFLMAEGETEDEIQIPGDPPRIFEINISPLYDLLKRLDGRVIVARDITERKWLEDDLKYSNESLVNQLAEIQRLRTELEEQAMHDPLTNAYNRRYLSEFLEKEISRAQRDKTSVTVVILDADNFKQFNDSYGHKCGDLILQAITKFLIDHSRRGDVVCRYGGEEFVILMPNLSLEIGYERAETWRQSFSEAPIEYEGIQLFATFSAGVATFPQHGSTGEALLQSADKALLQAKAAGKNRVLQYSPS